MQFLILLLLLDCHPAIHTQSLKLPHRLSQNPSLRVQYLPLVLTLPKHRHRFAFQPLQYDRILGSTEIHQTIPREIRLFPRRRRHTVNRRTQQRIRKFGQRVTNVYDGMVGLGMDVIPAISGSVGWVVDGRWKVHLQSSDAVEEDGQGPIVCVRAQSRTAVACRLWGGLDDTDVVARGLGDAVKGL